MKKTETIANHYANIPGTKPGWIVRLRKIQGGKTITRWCATAGSCASRTRARVFDTQDGAIHHADITFPTWHRAVMPSLAGKKDGEDKKPASREESAGSIAAAMLLVNLSKPNVLQALGVVLVEVLAPLALLALAIPPKKTTAAPVLTEDDAVKAGTRAVCPKHPGRFMERFGIRARCRLCDPRGCEPTTPICMASHTGRMWMKSVDSECVLASHPAGTEHMSVSGKTWS